MNKQSIKLLAHRLLYLHVKILFYVPIIWATAIKLFYPCEIGKWNMRIDAVGCCLFTLYFGGIIFAKWKEKLK